MNKNKRIKWGLLLTMLTGLVIIVFLIIYFLTGNVSPNKIFNNTLSAIGYDLNLSININDNKKLSYDFVIDNKNNIQKVLEIKTVDSVESKTSYIIDYGNNKMYLVTNLSSTSINILDMINVKDFINILNNSSSKTKIGNRTYKVDLSKEDIKSELLKGSPICEYYDCMSNIENTSATIKLNSLSALESIEVNISSIKLVYTFSNYSKKTILVPANDYNDENSGVSVTEGELVTE